MAGSTIVGVFDTVDAAEQARAQLTELGVPADRIVVSGQLTADGIAAEEPGQSYEHQSYRGSAGRDTDWARYNTAVRTGACLLTVSSESSDERRRIEALLRHQGARITMERPPP